MFEDRGGRGELKRIPKERDYWEEEKAARRKREPNQGGRSARTEKENPKRTRSASAQETLYRAESISHTAQRVHSYTTLRKEWPKTGIPARRDVEVGKRLASTIKRETNQNEKENSSSSTTWYPLKKRTRVNARMYFDNTGKISVCSELTRHKPRSTIRNENEPKRGKIPERALNESLGTLQLPGTTESTKNERATNKEPKGIGSRKKVRQ